MFRLALNTAPASEPMTTAQAKTHLIVEHALDDTYIDALILAARMQVENYLKRALITQTWTATLDRFPYSSYTPIEMPRAPLQSVTHIKYIDGDGTQQTWSSASYTVSTVSDDQPARILPIYGEVWPSIRPYPDAVEIKFITGYGDASTDIPAPIIHAIKLLVATYYEHRQSITTLSVSELPIAYKKLLAPYRLHLF